MEEKQKTRIEVQLIDGVPTSVEVPIEPTQVKAASSGDVLELRHKEWLTHPMTNLLIDNLIKRKEASIKISSKACHQDIPDFTFRLYAAEVALIDALIFHIKTTESFIQYRKGDK